MNNRALGKWMVLIAMLFVLTACGKSAPSEKQIAKDLPEEARTIYIDIDDNGEESFVLDVQNIEIEKRQTNEKDDTVYCTITMENDEYRYVGDYILYYNYYDKGGWILDNWLDSTDSDGNSSGEIIPLSGVTQDVADMRISYYYFDSYSCKNRDFSAETYEEEWGTWNYYYTKFIYDVAYDGAWCDYDGEVTLGYNFYGSEGRYGTWTAELGYDNPFDCSELVGVWKAALQDDSWLTADFEMDIQSFDEENGVAALSANLTEQWFGGDEEVSDTDGVIDASYWVDTWGEYDDDLGEYTGEYDPPRVMLNFSLGEDSCDVTIGNDETTVYYPSYGTEELYYVS